MLRLTVHQSPYWLDLPEGVRVKVRPPTTAILEACHALAVQRVRDLLESMAEVEDAGAIVHGLPDLKTLAGRTGYGRALFAAVLGEAVIVDWDGVGDETGNPVPVGQPWLDALMGRHDMAEAFVERYGFIQRLVSTEGEA